MTVTQNGRRLKIVITVTAGTPQFLMPAMPFPVMADRVLIYMEFGSGGYGKVYNDVPVQDTPTGTIYPAAANIPTVCGPPEPIGPSTATDPGSTYQEDPASDPYNGIDLRTLAIDGSFSTDVIVADCHLKI